MKHLLTTTCFLVMSFLFVGSTYAQLEDFETETIGATSFTDNGQTFNIAGGLGDSYDIETVAGAGWNGTATDNVFIDNSFSTTVLGDGTQFTITTAGGVDIYVNSFYVFLSTNALANPTSPSVTVVGRRDGVQQFTFTKTTGFSNVATFTPTNGFTFFDLSTEGGSDNSNTAIDEIIVTSAGNGDYMALDAFNWENLPACTDPTVPTLTHSPTTVCAGGTASIDITGTLNDATAWQVYTGSCGGTNIGFTTSGAFLIPGVINTPTTYFVRGEGGCVAAGACATITITPQTIVSGGMSVLSNYCINDGVQSGLGGGTPTGGVYSGAGVTDDGNGTTYSFDPAAAGVGVHSITYTPAGACTTPANDNVEVFALPTVSFTAPADRCVDAGAQVESFAGSPSGGVFSGAGVTDNSDGFSYTFTPAAAGVGIHTITYTFTSATGCTSSASDQVEVFALPSVTFTALADLCIGDGVQTGLGSGTPIAGVYSGTGVTDDGNGMTYSFDPAAAGVGIHTITYSYTDGNGCSNSASDDVEVLAGTIAAYTAPADLCINAGVQAGLGGGTPTGGVYSGPGVTDDGDGMTYSFDPAAAGVGIHTITYTPAGGCSTPANDQVEVFALPTVTFTALADLCLDAGTQVESFTGLPTGGVYSGAGVTDFGGGTTYSFDPAAAGVGTHTITYTFTNVNGCTGSATDQVEVFSLPTVTFTALADLCVNDGVQSGLGGGTPPQGSVAGDMGEYTGAGVTDDGNGMTYSFDPAAAGVGTHTITYSYTDGNGCSNSASDDVEVLAVSAGSITALADLCINAGVQNGLGGGTPLGGTYSGSGVTDNGDDTYDFDPMSAGVGNHTITYTPAGSCATAGTDQVEVFALPTVTFTAPADLCLGAGIQAALGGGTPLGGTYSGAGVTDNGDDTYDFDPMSAGVGVHTISYSYINANGCTNLASDQVEVFAAPTVTFAALADLCVNDGVQAGLGGGTPPQGTGIGDMGEYSGTGVTDDGNGMTYSFDPAAAGVGIHTITYSYTDGNGCSNSASDDVEVIGTPTVTFTAPGPFCLTQGVQTGLGGGTPTGGVYSGTGVTDDGNGTTYSFDPAAAGVGTHTVTYTVNSGGCIASASDDITVTSGGAVTAVCQDATIYLDANGDATLSPSDIDGGSSAGCGTLNLTASITSFNCSNVGAPTLVTLTVTDGLGGSATCDANVTVLDTVSPVAGCLDATVYLDASGSATITPADVTNSGTLFFTSFNNEVYEVSRNGSGTPTVVYGSGTSNDLLVGIDYIPQTGELMWANGLATEITTAPADGSGPITILPNSQGTGANAVHSSDVDFANGRYFFSANQEGIYEATLDGIGSSTLVSGAVPGLNTVEYDATNMRLFTNSVQGDTIYSMNDDGTGLATLFTDADGVDGPRDIVYDDALDVIYWTNRNGGNIMVGNADGTGTPTVVYSGLNGLYEIELDQASGLLYWVESQGSTDDIMSAPKDGTGTPAVLHTGSFGIVRGLALGLPPTGNTDNCSVASETIDVSSFDCSNVGANTVTLTVTDASGNTATCASTVTVMDTVAPTITCPADIVADQAGTTTCSADVTVPNILTADNCLGETIAWTVSGATTATGTGQPGVQTFAVGLSTVDVVATDASGNSANCSFTVTVNDTVAPVLPVLADSVAECSVTLAVPTTTDNCSGTITATTTDPTTVTAQGTTVVTWTFDDGAGNVTTATQNVIISDAVFPTASDIDTVFAECIGDVAIDITLVDDEADNCTAAPVVAHVGDVASNGTGCNDTITRSYSVTDDAGNSINVEQVIILNDVTPPTASNPIALSVVCLADVPSTAVAASWVTDEADNCGNPTVTWLSDVSSNGTGCNDTITRTIEVADVCGNSIQVQQMIIVNDNDAPVADLATLTDVTGICDVTPTAPTATDNCAGALSGLPDVTFPISAVGTTVVTWTYTDNCGNTASQTQNVIVSGVDVGTTMASDGITMIATNINAGVTYQWIDCETNDPVAGATNVNFTPTYGSDFAVIVTENGCSDTSACVNSTVGLDQLELNQFTMFPNPTQNGSFTIQLDVALKEVSVLDMTGRLVAVDVNLTEKAVNVSNLVNGAYIVRVVTETEQELVGTIRVQ